MDTTAQKARLLSLGILNEGMDALMEIFDIPVLKQRVRDLYRARERMYNVQDAVTVAIGDLRKYLKTARPQRTALDRDVKALLLDDDENNDKDAELLRVQFNALDEEIKKREERLAAKEAEFADNDECIKFLTMLYEQGVARVKELEEAKEDTKAVEASTDAMEGAQAVVGKTKGLDDYGGKILEKNRRAHQRHKRVVGSISDAMGNTDAVAKARADIIALKASLKKGA